MGRFHVLKLDIDIEHVFDGFLDSLSEDARNGNLDPPESMRTAENRYGPIYDADKCIENLKVDLLVDGDSVDAFKLHDSLTVAYTFTLK